MSDQTSCQMDFFPAVDGFDFVDDKLFAIPAHSDVTLRTLYITRVREQVLAFHSLQCLCSFIPPDNSQQKGIALGEPQMLLFQ